MVLKDVPGQDFVKLLLAFLCLEYL